MKNATKEILAKYPNLGLYVETKEAQSNWNSLNAHEQALASLSRFFEYGETFDINRIFKEMEPEWIPFALEQLSTYFYEDTYLAKTEKPLIIKDPGDLLNQSDFALLMQVHGNNTDAKKIHMSRKRGKLKRDDYD